MDDGNEQLDRFLASYEQEAYKMAYIMTRDREDALEIVQDSMMKLVQNYRHKSPDEWRLLFFRILQNRIRDFYRRRHFRLLLHSFLPLAKPDSDEDPWQQVRDEKIETPEQRSLSEATLEQIVAALHRLPLRQQQSFLLRAWQGFTTRETAQALEISEGSVKTHYQRAIAHLQKTLGEINEPA
jgi:RNA polymerase sigma-70 factor (ECF subfamily)